MEHEEAADDNGGSITVDSMRCSSYRIFEPPNWSPSPLLEKFNRPSFPLETLIYLYLSFLSINFIDLNEFVKR